MKEDRRKQPLMISTNMLLSVIILLISGYTTYVVTSLENKIDKNFKFVMECKDVIAFVKEGLSSHLSWHKGRE